MRKTSALLLGIGVAGALSALALPAQAEPPSTPSDSSIVAVGSDTIQAVSDQFQADYTGTPAFYSYDATPAGNITPKQGCTAITRPNGSGSGIAALGSNTHPAGDTADYCIDIARSSRGPSSTDPTGLAFVPFALDAVTWSANKKTNAPTTLTTNQLKAIYSCDASILSGDLSGPVTWSEVGGTGNAAVVPVIPQSTSGTRTYFLAQIGVTTLGGCVQPTDNSVEENEGTNPIFSDSDAINEVFPYSVAVYLAQSEHNHTGNGTPGNLKLRKVNGVSPTTGKNPDTIINKRFPYTRDVYYVVRSTGKRAKYVPTYLQPLVGANDGSGFICSAAESSEITSYGFLSLGTGCGKISLLT